MEVCKNENKGPGSLKVRRRGPLKNLTLGGIVRVMSAAPSPIIQDGKLIGACQPNVFHIQINDPTRGYGIFMENMLGH